MTTPFRILVNGQPEAALCAYDRGLMYGDGVFRTLRVRDGRPVWWADHMAKLAADAERLAIPSPPAEAWARDVADVLPSLPKACVLKLVLTRGPGLRGYAPDGKLTPTRVLLASSWPQQIETVAARGARLRLCHLRLAEQPLLAGIKHLNRLENVLAAMACADAGIDEGLLLDAAGRVVGGTRSNVFIYRQGALFTPRLHRCGVAGVARARLMQAANDLKLPVHEADITLEQLLKAEEVMLTNSLIRVWPVACLGERSWDPPRVSRELRRLLDADAHAT